MCLHSKLTHHGTNRFSRLQVEDPNLTTQKTTKIYIGLCGAGLGGLAAAIALHRAGAQVTVLEAAPSLGEIGAGIQMTPNVSRLLIKWGKSALIQISHAIAGSLTAPSCRRSDRREPVEFEELNLRRRDGTKVGYTRMVPNVRRDLGYP
jgi:salicylate hydroxylase